MISLDKLKQSRYYEIPSQFLNDVIIDEWEVHPQNIHLSSKLGEGEFGTVHIAKVKIDSLRRYRDLFHKIINDDAEEFVMAAVKVVNGL